jgi:F0F1-type ATP synthase membrane subunit c/vacuolar-type H+-ATPase subunit K
MTRHVLPVGIAVALALVGCGKVQEKAAEKAAEKMIESSMSKDGAQAKVDGQCQDQRG